MDIYKPDDFTYSITRQMLTRIIADEDKETYEEIQTYCKANNIIPNIISEDKLKLVLRLGIAELSRRNLESEGE